MTVEQFDPKEPIKSSNSAESQTTTLATPAKIIEVQHNEAVLLVQNQIALQR